MATYNIHAGHNWHVTGAHGVLSETKENREVKNRVIALLRAQGHTVYDCTDEDGKTQSQNLANIVKKCNQHSVDLDVSIHFNAFNKKAYGTETYQYSSKTNAVASRICSNIAKLGYKNRGVLIKTNLYVLRRTNSKAILVECCFCDNESDAKKYNADTMAEAIVEGILNIDINTKPTTSTPTTTTTTQNTTTVGNVYRIRKTWADTKSQVGAYKSLDGAKSACPEGYTVFDWNGKAVYTNTPVVVETVEKYYRIRKSWDDVKSQLGAYKGLDSAKKNCPSGYSVFDWEGKEVYTNSASTSATPNSDLYRVRKSWDDAKSQIGAFKELANAKAACVEGYTVYDGNGNAVYSYTKPTTSTDSKDDSSTTTNPTEPEVPATPVAPEAKDISPLKGVNRDTFIEYVGTLAKEDMKKTGILASVTIAQAILESSWGQSELSLKANNLFGMKASLSGNTWASEWDGKIYAKRSNEEYEEGVITSVLSDFRAYDDPAKSIKDHSDYLCGAKKGSELRYKGLKGETDYKKAIQIIKDGGYATDSKYVDKVVNLIEKHNLDVWDMVASPSDLDDIRQDIDDMNTVLANILEIVQGIMNFLSKIFK